MERGTWYLAGGIQQDQEILLSMDKFGGYKTEVKERIERKKGKPTSRVKKGS